MSEQENYLVVGSGNMACRHIQNLKKLFPLSKVGCVPSTEKKRTPQSVGADVIYLDLTEAIVDNPLFAVIANPAPFHLEKAQLLLENNIAVFIEKPLSDGLITYKAMGDVFRRHQHRIEMGYNLRYLPSALFLKKYLTEGLLGNPRSITIDVGQFLPHWRPKTDYRNNVSAQKSLGGGVLLELSHELDYLTWLFGDFDQVFCQTSTSGLLDLDVEDVADAIFMRRDGVVVNLHMDLLQHSSTRTCKIIGSLGTLTWNLIANSLVMTSPSGEATLLFENNQYDRNQMYLDELSRFAKVAKGEMTPAVSFEQGLKVLAMVDAMKDSSRTQKIVALKECL